MTEIQRMLLVSFLIVFSVHDWMFRTIPPWLCGSAIGLMLALWASDLSPWWWSSAILAAGVFWVGGLPMGDRAGIFVVGGLLPPLQAAQLALLAMGVGLLYLEGFGRHRSMIGVPFFPAVAVCAMVVVAWHRWG